jgi:ribonucleoside-diphosphate reductase alpha chain
MGKECPLNAVARNVAAKRYYRKDEDGNNIEDWDGLVKRVTKAVCGHEPPQFQKKISKLIYSTKFLPNSPCLVNAGNVVGGLLACFVTKSPEDSWVGMCENIANFGHIARRGGGCGVDFSQIRPSGDRVFGSTHYKACGPVNHMIVVSEAMNSITQAGFRGMANMGVLRVDHPDIEKFVLCKQREFALKYLLKEDFFNHFEKLNGHTHEHANILLDKFISNFNISVLTTDEFMQAVEKNDSFELRFKETSYGQIKARKLFDTIVDNAWNNGDPGLIFYDTMNRGPYAYSGQIVTATNPCVVAGSLVATQKGWIPVEDVHEGDLIWSRNSLYPVKTKEINHGCRVYRVEFTDGDHIDVTAAHRFKCVVSKKYEYRRLDELCEGSKVLVEPIDLSRMVRNDIYETISQKDFEILEQKGIKEHLILGGHTGNQRDLGLILGAVIGDGCFTEGSNRYNVKVAFGHHEAAWQSKFKQKLDRYLIKNSLETGESSNRITSNALGWLLEVFGLKRNKAPDKTIPENILQSNNRDLLVGLLDGLFSTDGNMYLKEDNPMLRFTSASHELCKQIRRILLAFGIHARIYKTDRKQHIYCDPKYGARKISSENPKYDVVIMNKGIAQFHHAVSLTNPDKEDKISKCVATYHYVGTSWTATIKSITPLDGEHTVYDLYNEETDEWNVNGYVQQGCGEQMLPQWGSCNLGSIDVSKFYNANSNDVDWDELRDAIRTAFQFLDNVIDRNKFPTAEFEKWAEDNRPVGLGIMGWADLLLKKKVAYGDEESLAYAEKLSKFFKDVAHEKSVELAEERGTPKSCQYRELDYRRNVTTLSIAPTGSIALIAGCNGSIEPFYAPTTFRSDNTGSYKMEHPEANEEYFRCAVDKENDGRREVHWQQHIDMQAAFQKNVDSGISKTINMPTSATIEDVANAYFRAWKNGCKGITIYRDECKTTQVLTSDDKTSTNYGSSSANSRPKSIDCDIYKTSAEGMQWHIIVGLLNGQPYEIFAVNGGFEELPSQGQVVKKKKRHYSLLDESDGVLIDNLNEVEEEIDPRLGLETRRFSLELRHGIPPKYIVQQIDKSSDKLTSFSKAVGRILKKHYLTVEEIVAVSDDKYCEKCAQKGKKTEMQPESGCLKCPDCFHSRCG